MSEGEVREREEQARETGCIRGRKRARGIANLMRQSVHWNY